MGKQYLDTRQLTWKFNVKLIPFLLRLCLNFMTWWSLNLELTNLMFVTSVRHKYEVPISKHWNFERLFVTSSTYATQPQSMKWYRFKTLLLGAQSLISNNKGLSRLRYYLVRKTEYVAKLDEENSKLFRNLLVASLLRIAVFETSFNFFVWFLFSWRNRVSVCNFCTLKF